MKKTHIALLALTAAALSFTSCSKTPAPKGWHLVWSDEFNSSKIDETKWDFQTGTGDQYGLDHWGNAELQYYTKDNAYIEKGNLVIEAKKESMNGEAYTSSRLRTVKEDGTVLFAKTYGRIEAKIKMPKGNGIWPAFWLLPATNDYDVWASSGEIDILEVKGRLPNRVYGTVHFGQAWPGNKNSGDLYKFPQGTDITDYHVYALEWEPGLLRWLVDDNVFYETQQWWALGRNETEPYPYPAPYDKPFYILLNFALGGNFDGGVAPDASFESAKMYVDYVRVYDKDEPYNTNVTRPTPKRDETSFNSYTTSDGSNFIFDSSIANTEKTAAEENEMDVKERKWYFLALTDYAGKATSSTVTKDGTTYRKVDISSVGNQPYSIQLIQHLPIAEGYTYRVEFDAYASADRTMAIKVGGDGDNGWAVYSPEYYPALTTEPQHYSYIFTMENKTDATARLEFNMGLNDASIYISNVKVTQAEL